MTAPKPDAINHCVECDVEYPAHRCAPCPLCRLRIACEEANQALWQAEPWRVIKAEGHLEMQEYLNEYSASGWILDSFHVSHQETTRYGPGPVYVAVLKRSAHDRESHALRRAAHKQVFEDYLAKREALEAETAAFRAARVREAQ